MLLLHAPNACDRNRAISCTNDLACLLALLELKILILFNRLPNKTEYPASTQNQTKESINIMNIYELLNHHCCTEPPWHTECAPCWWLMALLPTIPRVGHWNGGTSVAWGCPADCGTSERLKHFVERCGKVLRRNQKSPKMSHMRDLWDLWDSLSALSSAKPPKTNTRGEVASQGNSAWRLLGQHECCFQQCGTQVAWGTTCPHSLHINASTELLHAYDILWSVFIWG